LAYVRIIGEQEAEGTLARVYDAAKKRAGRIFNILKIQSQSPPALQAGMNAYAVIMKGESSLSRAQREMLAVVVSKINGCHY
jgi:uncharacterized peroxidase-related enzyme